MSLAAHLAALAEEIGRTFAPSREIDGKIAQTIGWTTYYEEDGNDRIERWKDPKGDKRRLPRFTRDIEAALTLTPRSRWAATLSWACYEQRHGDVDPSSIASRVCFSAVNHWYRAEARLCPVMKAGEFNTLRCCRSVGHSGEHNYAVYHGVMEEAHDTGR